jgi:hypothetical protein
MLHNTSDEGIFHLQSGGSPTTRITVSAVIFQARSVYSYPERVEILSSHDEERVEFS